MSASNQRPRLLTPIAEPLQTSQTVRCVTDETFVGAGDSLAYVLARRLWSRLADVLTCLVMSECDNRALHWYGHNKRHTVLITPICPAGRQDDLGAGH